MNIYYEESLLEDNDVMEDGIDSIEENGSPRKLDARRLIERHQELLCLRELLDDPDFNFDSG